MTILIDRRSLLAVSALGAMAAAASATTASPKLTPMTVYKDANCGCCKAWVERLRADGRFAVKAVDTPDLAAVKQRLGVPADLVACHTGVVAGLVIEGHVPPADIGRLIAARPAGVRGLAVPGMPAGSPGMETPSGDRETFEVVAFGPKGRSVFARHG